MIVEARVKETGGKAKKRVNTQGKTSKRYHAL